jgi:hypothetical protein
MKSDRIVLKVKADKHWEAKPSRVNTAFKEVIRVVHEEANKAARALGFGKGAALKLALELEIAKGDGLPDDRLKRLPPAIRARIECAETISYLLFWPLWETEHGYGEELGFICRSVEYLHQNLAIAMGRKKVVKITKSRKKVELRIAKGHKAAA